MKFYVCEHGKGIAAFLTDDEACRQQGFKELVPGSVDAAQEKHVPVRVSTEHAGHVTVSVGEVEHPMEEKHLIEWVVLETDQGASIRHLRPGHPPRATFAVLPDEKVQAVYAYCNLHGLWKA